jgi:hypothetical protein
MQTTWTKDAIERVVWTALQAGVAVIVASQGFGLDVIKTAAIAAGLSLVKAVGAKGIGDPNSASTLSANNSEAK